MRGRPPIHVTPYTIASWQNRLATLCDLKEQPGDHPMRWLWQVRIDVLKFLIGRYAPGAARQDRPTVEPVAAHASTAGGDGITPAVVASDGWHTPARQQEPLVPPKHRAELHRYLDDIARTNEPRHRELRALEEQAHKRIAAEQASCYPLPPRLIAELLLLGTRLSQWVTDVADAPPPLPPTPEELREEMLLRLLNDPTPPEDPPELPDDLTR